MKLNLNFNLSEFSKRPSVTIAFSIICSVVLWFVITSSGETDWKKTVHDVPVEINLPSTSDLNVVEGEDATVTAEFRVCATISVIFMEKMCVCRLL